MKSQKNWSEMSTIPPLDEIMIKDELQVTKTQKT